MSADRLREAARVLRERAEAATPGPWQSVVLGSEGYAVLADRPEGERRRSRVRISRHGWEEWDTDKANAIYIATMHPGVGLALADWLEAVDRAARLAGVAASHPEALSIRAKALAVADAILGGAR